MKYFSEITKELYDSKEELVKAEVEATKAKSDRAERAKEVTEAIKAANEATKYANKLLEEFVKDYGSFKTTIKDDNADVSSGVWNIFNKLFW